MEAKQKNHPKASVVMAKKPVHRGAKTAKEGAAASVKAYSPFKTVRGIVALVLFVCALFALLSMVLWTKFPKLWQPIVLPGRTLLSIFSWAAYYLPMWLLMGSSSCVYTTILSKNYLSVGRISASFYSADRICANFN